MNYTALLKKQNSTIEIKKKLVRDMQASCKTVENYCAKTVCANCEYFTDTRFCGCPLTNEKEKAITEQMAEELKADVYYINYVTRDGQNNIRH